MMPLGSEELSRCNLDTADTLMAPILLCDWDLSLTSSGPLGAIPTLFPHHPITTIDRLLSACAPPQCPRVLLKTGSPSL